MLSALFFGVLTSEPEVRINTQGQEYVVARARGLGEDRTDVFASLTVFSRACIETLEPLHAGDAVVVSGPASVRPWMSADSQLRSTLRIRVITAQTVSDSSDDRRATREESKRQEAQPDAEDVE